MRAVSRYSFGMAQPGRTFTGATGYEYGFNNMRRDDEWNGTSATYDFGARMYDARIGRWWAVDPLYFDYFDLSSYSFCGNSPIAFIDIDGNRFVNPYTTKVQTAQNDVTTAQQAYNEFVKNNPNLTPKELKNSAEATKLKEAQAALTELRKKEKLVDDFVFTLKVTNYKEWEYFETLRENGKDVLISVELGDENSINGDLGAVKGLVVSFINLPNGDISIESKTRNNELVIVLYSKNSIGIDGQTYGSFTNELGDIKYVFDHVVDLSSMKKWKATSESTSSRYKEPDGAGEYSWQYESSRLKDVKNYKTKENEKKDPFKRTIVKNQ